MRFVLKLKTMGMFCLSLVLSTVMIHSKISAYSASKVWMESLDDGRYRVKIRYTVPALREFREAHAIFSKKKEADVFFWQLVKGGEFSVNGSQEIRFTPPKSAPTPW